MNLFVVFIFFIFILFRYIKKTLETPEDREPNILVQHIEKQTKEWFDVVDELQDYLSPTTYPLDGADISDFTFSGERK